MRDSQSTGEVAAVAALTKYLVQEGFRNVNQIPEITDRPDCVFKTDRGRIACEIATIVPDTILRFYHRKGRADPVGELFEYVLPLEPHEWARRIVERKSKKHADYVARSHTSNVWLLLHWKAEGTKLLEPATESDLNLMRYGTQLVRHKFRHVLFYDGSTIRPIFNHKIRTTRSIQYQLAKGYPTTVLRYFNLGTFRGMPPSGYGRYEILPTDLPVARREVIAPLDLQYAATSPNVDHEIKPVVLTLGTPSTDGEEVPIDRTFPEFAAVLRSHRERVAESATPS